MRVISRYLGIILFLVLSLSVARAQGFKQICDTSCGGTTSSSDSTLITSRSAPGATRGPGVFPNPVLKVPKIASIAGSQSFSYGVPLFSLSGRTGMNLVLNLYYNSFVWTPSGPTGNLLTLNADHDSPSPGFRVDFGWLNFSTDGSVGVLTDANGTKHPIGVVPASAGGPAGYKTIDGSDIQFQSGTNSYIAVYKDGLKATYTLINPNGFDLSYRPVSMEDTNGNVISIAYMNNTNTAISSVTDTLGRVVNFFYDSTGTMLNCVTTAANCTTPNSQTYTFSWNQNYVLNFSFTKSTGTVLKSGSTILNVLTGVTRPDGTSVSFGYGDWGIVNSIQELSANSSVRFSATANFPAASAGALPGNPGYTQQTIFDGVNTAVWNYNVTRNGTTGAVTSFAVADPAGTTSTIAISSAGLPTQEVVGATQACSPTPCTTVHRTVNKTWVNDSLGVPRLTSMTSILEDDVTQSAVAFAYDLNGNFTHIQEYDFGSGSHGGLLRDTTIAYAPLGNGIANRVSDIQVKDGSGNLVAHEALTYDEGTLTSEPVNPPGHDAGFAATVRGNLTTLTVYSNPATAGGPVSAKYTYDNLGNLLSYQYGCCVFMHETYSSNTQYAYPDSIIRGPSGNQLVTSLTYNLATGTIASSTDPNGQKTTYGYDIDNRQTSVQTPDLASTTVSYDDLSANAASSVSSSANSRVEKQIMNGAGQVITRQLLNGTALVNTTSFNFDPVGHLLASSNPYGPGETALYSNFVYDPLGRPVQATPPALSSAAAQNPYITAYSTNTVTSTDPAGLQRKSYQDALGRLIRVDEPGLINGQFAAASATITGAEKSVATTSGNGATAGTASVTVTPTTQADRSTQVLTHAATSGSITISVSGGDGAEQSCTDAQPPRKPVCTTIYDTGSLSVSVNVGGTTLTPPAANYGRFTTPANIASALASGFSSNYGSTFIVNYTTGATSFTLQATAAGAATNYPVTYTITSAQGASGFRFSTAPAAFSGGTDNVFTTFFDTGNVTVSFTANGTNYSESVPYGQNDTGITLVSALTQKMNSDPVINSVVVANASSNVLQLTTLATGAATNYPLSASAATNSQYFTSGSTSFTAAASGANFVPGQNGTLYDSGTIKATLNGFSKSAVTETVSFGQGSTPSSIATSMAAAFHNDPFSPVDATTAAGSATINFTARAQGTDANGYSITIAEQSSQPASFPTPSFPNVSVTLAGGVNPVSSLDPSVVLTTTYSYDPANNLLSVAQGQQTRTYRYDGLSRLTSASIPETGQLPITYTYTDFNAVSVKTDPRVLPGTSTHITATYGYDTLNRLASITYNDGTPNLTYTYNPPGSANNTGGRLASIAANGVMSESYTYDIMGRELQCLQTIGGINYPIGFTYNPDGSVGSITYPSGRVINYSMDAIGRLTQIGNNGASVYSVNSFNSAGGILNATFGNLTAAAFTYNNQLQLSTLQYGPSAAPLFSLTYNYGGGQDNGKIMGIADNVTSSRSTSYSYDELGRLKIAGTNDLTSSNTWQLRFLYDRYGNRLQQVPTAGTGNMPSSQLVVDPTTNHINGSAYDAAGNTINDGLFNYTFDAANRMTSVAQPGSAPLATFGYDPYGLRIIKNGTVYIYSGDKVIAEYATGAAAASPNVEYIYKGSRRVATVAGGATTYQLTDHLSVRVTTDSAGAVTRGFAHYPFGETWFETGTADKWKYLTYEQDAESGLNYAQARFQSPRSGRFMSLDPLSGNPGNPQSLNRYQMDDNDPVNNADPTGMAGGNWMCLLDDHGDCVGGDYAGAGLNATAGIGLWADPFGPWVDPTHWDPLAEGEAAYNEQVKLAFTMAQYGLDQLTYTRDPDGTLHIWIPGQVVPNPDYDPNHVPDPDHPSEKDAQYKMVSFWITIQPQAPGSGDKLDPMNSVVDYVKWLMQESKKPHDGFKAKFKFIACNQIAQESLMSKGEAAVLGIGAIIGGIAGQPEIAGPLALGAAVDGIKIYAASEANKLVGCGF